ARQSFRNGDYRSALTSVDQAITKQPGDVTLHEFRGLVLFALGAFDDAAATVYAVLSVGPGWNWETMARLYPDTHDYTNQLRALETYVRNTPAHANARFLLAYHYLIMGHNSSAVNELREVVKLAPTDKLSNQMLSALAGPSEGAGAGAVPPAPGANVR